MDTKKGVDYLQEILHKAKFNSIAIHGDKSQYFRQKAIRSFSQNEVKILIATDVASRGIDFPNVSHVFNFDMPTNIDDYIHRIGRSGRCGNKGKAISFISEESKPIADNLLKLLKKHNQTVPEWFANFCKIYPKKEGKKYFNLSKSIQY